MVLGKSSPKMEEKGIKMGKRPNHGLLRSLEDCHSIFCITLVDAILEMLDG